MELVSVELARVIWLIDAREINPRGLNLWHAFLPALAEKYKFVDYPREMNLDHNRDPGDRFFGGSYRNAQGMDVTINFTSFEDGMVAETRSSTRDSEAFLEGIAEWIVKDFSLVFSPEMIRMKGYVSEVIVTSECLLNSLNPKLDKFANRLSSLVYTQTETYIYQPAALSFSCDLAKGLRPSPFRFERKNDVPFSENKYYSQAPLQTDIHLELLNELEQILVI
ncbi:MAG: hypothetical protein WBV94_18155 [Blastocatellia bacterium]